MSRNFKVLGYAFGRYEQNSVIPEAAITLSGHNLKKLLDEGILAETNEASNVTLYIPPVEDRTADKLLLDLQQKTSLVAELQNTVAAHQAEAATEKARAEALAKELGAKVQEVDRLNGLLAEKDAAAEKLKAELEAANQLLNKAS